MKRIVLLCLAATSLALAGCATVSPHASFVSPEITASDANSLAYDAAEHLAHPLPPAQTTVVLYPAGVESDVMTPALSRQLRAAGYGVKQQSLLPDAPMAEGVRLRYLVSPLDSGVLMRLQYQGTEAARYYSRTSDRSLNASGPFTVKSRERSQ